MRIATNVRSETAHPRQCRPPHWIPGGSRVYKHERTFPLFRTYRSRVSHLDALHLPPMSRPRPGIAAAFHRDLSGVEEGSLALPDAHAPGTRSLSMAAPVPTAPPRSSFTPGRGCQPRGLSTSPSVFAISWNEHRVHLINHPRHPVGRAHNALVRRARSRPRRRDLATCFYGFARVWVLEPDDAVVATQGSRRGATSIRHRGLRGELLIFCSCDPCNSSGVAATARFRLLLLCPSRGGGLFKPEFQRWWGM